MTVKVLTIREAAKRAQVRRERIGVLLAGGELTEAKINDRPAVLHDRVFTRMVRKAGEAA